MICCRRLQRVEARLHHLEQVVGSHLSNIPASCRVPRSSDTVDHLEEVLANDKSQSPMSIGRFRTSPIPSVQGRGNAKDTDNDVDSQIHLEDPTNGMGHFVFADEEDRAFFGSSERPLLRP